MDKIQNYLDELYFLEEMEIVLEDISDLAGPKLSKIKDQMVNAADTGDINKLQRIASIIPKVSEDKLYKLGEKAHPRFKETYKYAEKEVSKKLNVKDAKALKVTSSVVAAMACVANNPKEKSTKIIEAIKTKRDAKKQQFGALGLGLLGVILAGAFLASAFASLSLFPLLLSLVIVGVAIMIMMGGAAAA